ncbi:MAG TPA: aldo/keto reductase [Bryobacteraceae bacterium]|jgi:L-galactose dehydrogenase|nr:aldo/keto reductase [Bryobacteraceae bacterium]
MQYRILGKTGMRVSALSLGGSQMGGGFGPVAQAEANRTVRTAFDLGINYVDTSPYYGLTEAERVLGEALRGIPRDRYFLATKVGRYGDAEFDFSAARVARSVEESLVRLGLEYVDLIQCHDIEFGSAEQIAGETIPALRQVQQQGKVRFVGITGLPLSVLRAVAGRIEVDCVLSYCHYCLNDTSLAGILPFLEARGVGIVNAAPLAMGLLTGKPLPQWHPAPAVLREACRRAYEFCEKRGASLPRVALQFALANPAVHTTIVGTANPEEIRRNAEWASQPPDAELLAGIQGILAPVMDLTWSSGLNRTTVS